MKFLNLHNYKEAYKIYNLLQIKNHTNLIIHSNKNVDKTEFIKVIMEDIFKAKTKTIDDDIRYEYNEYYYYFNMLNIKYSQKKKFTGVIKDIVNSYNYYTGFCNYIILDNFNDINILFENYLKVVIENNIHTTKFIILTNSINKVIPAIRSRCLCIRLSELNNFQKEIYIHNMIKQNNLKNINISELFQYDIKTIEKKLLYNYKDEKYFMLKKIIRFFRKPLNKNLVELKDLSYNIKNSLIDFSSLCKCIIQHYIKENISDIKKSKIIKEITETNHLMINCYKSIIFIETLLLSLYNIINE